MADIVVTGADGVLTKVLGGVDYTATNEPLSWAWGSGGVGYQRGYGGWARRTTSTATTIRATARPTRSAASPTSSR